ncbi:MAG: DNA-binding response regulator, partial [Streptosporangiales bacterium]|nr:DNA-binding response regulator [Streptosporangiales bacterium]
MSLARVPVQILADDPVSRAGIGSVLRYRPELELVDSLDRA